MTPTNTLIVGTSKSKDVDAYYVKSKEKFWGVIFKAGLSDVLLNPSDYAKFTASTGIGFWDLAYDNIIVDDKTLKEKPEVILNGLKFFVGILNSPKAPNRIAFNGKTAAGWFFYFLDHGKFVKNGNMAFKEIFPNFNYGRLPRSYKDTEIHVLPNTSGVASKYWDEECWIKFWKLHIKSNS